MAITATWTHLFDSDDSFASNQVAQIGVKTAPGSTVAVANNTTLATGVASINTGTIVIAFTPSHSYTGSALETYVGLTKDSGTDQKIWYDSNSTTRRFAASSRLNFGTTRSMSEPSATHASNATVQIPQVMALAWSAAGASLYRNGVLIGTSSTANTAASGTATLKVGPLSDLISSLPVRFVALSSNRISDADLATLTGAPDGEIYATEGASQPANYNASGLALSSLAGSSAAQGRASDAASGLSVSVSIGASVAKGRAADSSFGAAVSVDIGSSAAKGRASKASSGIVANSFAGSSVATVSQVAKLASSASSGMQINASAGQSTAKGRASVISSGLSVSALAGSSTFERFEPSADRTYPAYPENRRSSILAENRRYAVPQESRQSNIIAENRGS